LTILDARGRELAASSDGWMGPGQWHRIEVDLVNDGIEEVRLQDVVIIDAVALPVGIEDIRLLAAHGPAGCADIRVKPVLSDSVGEAVLGEPGSTLGSVDFEMHGEEMYVSGGTGQVVFDVSLPPSCVIEFETRFQPIGLGWIDLGGERVLLGESPDGGPSTGTIAGRSAVKARLIADKTWARVRIELVPHVAMRFVKVSVGGVPVAEAIVSADAVSGPIAFGHQAETGWVAIRNVRISE
jgi:hypothetical protein